MRVLRPCSQMLLLGMGDGRCGSWHTTYLSNNGLKLKSGKGHPGISCTYEVFELCLQFQGIETE